jgi:5-methylcytosine-specific restriction endonuclease McrA
LTPPHGVDKKEKQFVTNALRRASLRWPARTKAKQAARISRGKYLCACCGGVTRAKDVSVDHVACVVDPETGFKDWNTYVERLFCSLENLQVLCRECHNAKSAQETVLRRQAKKSKAKPKPTRSMRKNKKAGPPPDEL